MEGKMNLLIKADSTLLVELTEDEAKFFCEQFLKHIELIRGQEAVDKVVKHYLGGEQQPPYELMLQ